MSHKPVLDRLTYLFYTLKTSSCLSNTETGVRTTVKQPNFYFVQDCTIVNKVLSVNSKATRYSENCVL